jgi:two-component system, OmpR family, sensor histidine kinase SenX3
MTAIVIVIAIAAAFVAGWAIGRSRQRHDIEAASMDELTGDISLGDVLEQHPTGIVIGDADGNVEYRNAAARRLAGTHAGLLIDEAIERHLALGRAGAVGDRAIELFGPPKMAFVISARPLPHSRSVAFVDDISERRRVEQTRTDFVANISHELKTPVGALSVLAETLVDETDLDTIGRVLARMLSETDRASRTIDDLMELSRIELGAESVSEPVRVAEVIRGGVDRVIELAARCDVTISTLAPVAPDGTEVDDLVVRGDRRQLVSAVGNLVENAVKYSDPGTSVQVRARRVDGWIEISVADQGVGIPQRDLDRVFERFYRVDRARSRTTGGTGLGLAIVRHVASNHAGDVTVSSVEGEGSTFVLRLPLSADDTSVRQSTGTSEGVA